jgi:signal recognition particle subunit SRP54
LKKILLDADVNLQVVNSLIDTVKSKAVGMQVVGDLNPGDQFVALLAREIQTLMGESESPLMKRKDNQPTVIMMLGLQGAGKTTQCAKLAQWMKQQGHSQKILLVAADTYRPAAIEQLKLLGSKLQMDVFSEMPTENNKNINPVQIAKKAVLKAKQEQYDAVIIDTAGRQVVDTMLMAELRQFKQSLLPDELLLVVDAMTGQEAATLTMKFNEEVGITGAILTKLDGDARGGAALSVRAVSGKPIKFIGVGEKMEDLEVFRPDRMTSRILGMGDMMTLLEKAQVRVKRIFNR